MNHIDLEDPHFTLNDWIDHIVDEDDWLEEEEEEEDILQRELIFPDEDPYIDDQFLVASYDW